MRPTLAVAICAAIAASACSAAQINSDNPPIPSSSKNAQQVTQSFEVFFNDFKLALSQDKLDALQTYTHFPLPVRGELDDTPTLYITKNEFAAFLTDLLAEPVYIEQNDELIARTLSELATPPKLEKTGQASWQGMIFRTTKERWALVEIITYDHIIEMHR